MNVLYQQLLITLTWIQRAQAHSPRRRCLHAWNQYYYAYERSVWPIALHIQVYCINIFKNHHTSFHSLQLVHTRAYILLRYMRTIVHTTCCAAVYYDLRDDYSYVLTTTGYIQTDWRAARQHSEPDHARLRVCRSCAVTILPHLKILGPMLEATSLHS